MSPLQPLLPDIPHQPGVLGQRFGQFFGAQTIFSGLSVANGATLTFYDSSGNVLQVLPSEAAPQKLTAAAATVTWSTLPTYANNIRIVWKARGTDAAIAVDLRGRINNDSGVNYSNQNETVTGASVTGANTSDTSFKVGSLVAAGSSASASSSGVIEIPGYTDAVLGGVGILTRCSYSQVASPAVTAKSEYDTCIYVAAAPVPVTRIDLFPAAGSFAIGSGFWLYPE